MKQRPTSQACQHQQVPLTLRELGAERKGFLQRANRNDRAARYCSSSAAAGYNLRPCGAASQVSKRGSKSRLVGTHLVQLQERFPSPLHGNSRKQQQDTRRGWQSFRGRGGWLKEEAAFRTRGSKKRLHAAPVSEVHTNCSSSSPPLLQQKPQPRVCFQASAFRNPRSPPRVVSAAHPHLPAPRATRHRPPPGQETQEPPLQHARSCTVSGRFAFLRFAHCSSIPRVSFIFSKSFLRTEVHNLVFSYKDMGKMYF